MKVIVLLDCGEGNNPCGVMESKRRDVIFLGSEEEDTVDGKKKKM